MCCFQSIYIGSDHGGFELKEDIVRYLRGEMSSRISNQTIDKKDKEVPHFHIDKDTVGDKSIVSTSYGATKSSKDTFNAVCTVYDIGTNTSESCDYPDFASVMSQKVQNNVTSCGILICRSGIGMSISVNRYKGIRAALCTRLDQVELSRKHNNANVLCLEGRNIDTEFSLKLVKMFLETSFSNEARHVQRIKMLDLEQ